VLNIRVYKIGPKRSNRLPQRHFGKPGRGRSATGYTISRNKNGNENSRQSEHVRHSLTYRGCRLALIRRRPDQLVDAAVDDLLHDPVAF
jgi:hypothetical protein